MRTILLAIALLVSNDLCCQTITVNQYSDRGLSKAVNGDHSGAVVDYTKALELDPNDGLTYYHRGISKRELEDYRGAIADFTRSIQLAPIPVDRTKGLVPIALYNRGLAKAYIRDLYGAIDDFTEVLKIDPNHSRSYVARGMMKSELKKYPEAISDLTQGIEMAPNDEFTRIAYYQRGLAKLNLGQKNSGCLDLSKAGELGNAQAYDEIKRYCN